MFVHQPSARAQEGVPAKVEVDSPVPGVVQSVCIVVSENLFDRAKRIIDQEPVSQRELDRLATMDHPDSVDAKA